MRFRRSFLSPSIGIPATGTLILAIALSWHFGRWHTRTSLPLPQGSNLLQYLVSPVALADHGNEDVGQVSEECVSQWRDLLSIDFNEYGKFSSGVELSFSLDRPEALLSRLQNRAQSRCVLPPGSFPQLAREMHAFDEACSDLPGQMQRRSETTGQEVGLWGSYSDGDGAGDVCLRETLRYRFLASDALYRHVPIQDISEVPLLLNLFFAEGIREDRAFSRLDALLAHVIDLEPQSYFAARYRAETAYAAWQAARTPQETDSRRRAFQDAMKFVEGFGRTDFEITRMRLREAAKTRDISRLQSRAQAALKSGFDSLGFYYLAWARYLKGDVAGAQSYLPAVWLSLTGDENEVAAVAWNRIQRAAPRVDPGAFLDEGYALDIAFTVPDGNARLVAGYVGFHLLPDPTPLDATSPEIASARNSLHTFQRDLRQCKRDNAFDEKKDPPLWQSGTPEMRECIQRAFASWDGVGEDSLHLGAR